MLVCVCVRESVSVCASVCVIVSSQVKSPLFI